MPKSTFHPVTHVIFDLDGLLLDTEKLYEKATQEFLNDHNIKYDFEVKQSIMGRSHEEGCKVIHKHYNLDCDVKGFIQTVEKSFQRLFPNANLMPGADRLVRHLHNCHVPMAVCTGSSTSYYNSKITHHQEFFKLFSHIVCSADDPEVKQTKPHPDPFLVTSRRFVNPPKCSKQVLIFEDSPNGVKAAQAAGMQVILVPDPRLTGEALKDADLVLRSLEDFMPHLFGLPEFVD